MTRGKGRKKIFSWKRFLKKLFLFFLFIAFVGVSGWTLFFSDYTKVNEIEIKTETINKENLEDISNNLKSQKLFQYIARDNFFLFPRRKFSDLARDKFKIIKEVNYKSDFPHKIIIEVEERKGMLVFCSREKCFLLDETGILFYELQAGEKEDRFKDLNIVIDNSFPELVLDQEMGSLNLVVLVEELKNQLDEKTELKISREIETPSLISEEIRVRTEDDWRVFFNLENDISIQVELLGEVLGSVIGNELDNLNYIDLRIDGKAIYNTNSGKNNEDDVKEENEEDEENDNEDD